MNTNVILSVSILPVSIPTLLVFPLRMRQSDLFISSTSPLTSFTVPGTGALMPRYRYVTPPPSLCACVNPIPSLLLLPPPPLTCLPYLAPGHRCLVVSVPVCNSFFFFFRVHNLLKTKSKKILCTEYKKNDNRKQGEKLCLKDWIMRVCANGVFERMKACACFERCKQLSRKRQPGRRNREQGSEGRKRERERERASSSEKGEIIVS